MNILIIGGSGLLGSHIADESLKRGHTVTILSRGSIDRKSMSDENLRHIRGDIYKLSNDEISTILAGQEGVVYAMGIDDRQTYRRPAYPQFHQDHVEICLKILKIAKAAGVKKFVVLGSYFTYFENKFPELKLVKNHIYIKTREEQRDAVLNETGPGFDTFVLELPYILGTQEGKVPPWTFLFSMLAAPGKVTLFFRKGGTAAVTAVQVGQAAIGAIEQGIGGKAYPLGGINYQWMDFAKKYFEITKNEKIVIPLYPVVFKIFGIISAFVLRLQGIERGLNIGKFTKFQYMEAYLDPASSMAVLGYNHDDYDAALLNVIEEWVKINSRRNPTTASA
jgi:nucleoside-diphosphate-sugar epimerase